MRIEATAQSIRLLVRLAAFDSGAHELPLEQFNRQRGAIRRRVAAVLRERYETLLETGRSPVVAAIERGTCTGCHIRLPTMIEVETRRSPAIHSCPHCGRMLYLPELLDRSGSGPRRPAAMAPRSARAWAS